MVATLQVRQSPDLIAKYTHDCHMVCPVGADLLSTPNLAWIQAALQLYANEL